jgi:hypothetical protein
MNQKFLTTVFIALLFIGASFVLSTTASLPDRVASHFGAEGLANGTMTRAGYRGFMLFFTVGFPTLVVLGVGWLPRIIPQYTNIPNPNYWFAPERRAQVFDFLMTHALWFGCLLVLFICAVHWLVVQANAQQPAQLAHGPFFTALGLFFAALTVWIITLYRRFRAP